MDEPWIPVIRQDGGRELLGIRETLKRAPELREISVDSPAEEFGIYRFLSVFLMDVFRPKTQEQIRETTRAGAFDEQEIEEYIKIFEASGKSFDIFDKDHPFMQPPYNEHWDREPESATRLDFTFPSGNNHVHFEHRPSSTVRYSFADIFRKLISTYVIMLQGGAGYSPSINGTPPYYLIVSCPNLFETLCAMLLPLDECQPYEEARPAISQLDDLEPKRIWEDVPFFLGMLFPVRRIILIPDADQDTVSQIYFRPGYKYGGGDNWTDPSVTYYYVPVGKTDKRNRYPLRGDATVNIWRNYAEIIREEGRAKLLTQYIENNPDKNDISVALYGLQADQAKCCNWLRCSLMIPRSVLENPDAADAIKECLQYSERLNKRLEYALRIAMQNEKPDISKKDAKKANADVKKACGLYLNRCEPLFLEMVSHVTEVRSEDQPSILDTWKKAAFAVAKKVYNETAGNIRANGKTLRKIAEGQRILYGMNRPNKEE